MAPDYYLENFLTLIEFVIKHYSDLLTAEELAFRNHFLELAADAQKLFVRLLTRRGPFIRRDKVNYAEITDLDNAINDLCRAGFLAVNQLPDSDSRWIVELLNTLTKAELVDLIVNDIAPLQEECDNSDITKSQLKKLKKEQLITVLTQQPTEQWTPALFDHFTMFLPMHLETFQIYQLAFFGNLHQSLTEFVIADLGHTRYESYEISHETRYFQSRNELEQTLQYYSVALLLDTEIKLLSADTLVSLFQSLEAPLTNSRHLQRRYDKLCNRIARQLERLAAHTEALKIYQCSQLHPSRERITRIMVKLDRPVEAKDLCLAILSSPRCEEEKEFGQFFLKKLDTDLWQRDFAHQESKQIEIPRSSLTLDFCENLAVETSMVQKLESQGGKAWHTENVLWNGLFGLFYWDLLFAPVVGAFHHPFQSGPADFNTPTFLPDRQALFDQAQARFTNPQLVQEFIQQKYQDKFQVSNRFVHWKGLSESLLTLALESLPTTLLQQVFARIWQDPKGNRSGFPDLIYFPEEGGYELIEVKAPGDRLQKNQVRWLNFFLTRNAPARVVDVNWSSSPSQP